MIRGRWSLGSSLFGDAGELVWAVAEEAVLRRFWKHSTLGKLFRGNPFPRWVNMNDPVYADADTGTQFIDEQGNLWTETQVGLKLPQPDEGAHDLDVHLHGSGAAQDLWARAARGHAPGS